MPDQEQDVTQPDTSAGEQEPKEAPETVETDWDDPAAWDRLLAGGETEAGDDEDATEPEQDAGEGEEEEEAGAEDEPDEDDEEPDDDLDAPRIPRRRLNEAVQKEREKRDRALEAAGLRWDEETQTAVPLETAEDEPDAEQPDPGRQERERAWFAMSADDMADDPGWKQVAEWYGQQGIPVDLDTLSDNEAALFKRQYKADLDAWNREQAGNEQAATEKIASWYDGLKDDEALAAFDEDTRAAVLTDVQEIFRAEARKRGGKASAMLDYTDTAVDRAIRKNLSRIVEAAAEGRLKAEKTRARAIAAGQAEAGAPAAKKPSAHLSAEEREVARQFGMTNEEYAAYKEQ